MTASSSREGAQDWYALPRDHAEGIRLAAQHYALIQRQGWLLHPIVDQHLCTISRPQIADVACGSGVWALDYAEKFLESSVTGLDISAQQFPAAHLWPFNCTFDILDLLQPIPDRYQSKFDLVHVRLLLNAGPPVDPKRWFLAFHGLLKPGGILQWEDMPYPLLLRVTPSVTTSGVASKVAVETELLPTLAKIISLPAKSEWYTSFSPICTEAGGFVNIKKVEPPIKLSVLAIESGAHRAAISSVINMVVKNGKLPDQALAGKLRGEMQELDEAEEHGSLWASNWMIRVAQKLQ